MRTVSEATTWLRLARSTAQPEEHMDAFLHSILAFPTVFFTVALGVVLVYWSLVFLGALDLDFLDMDVDLDLDLDGDGVLEGALEGAADGAIDGVAEGLDGAAEGLDGAAEGLDGAADGLDGAAEGADAGDAGGLLGPLGWLYGLLRVGNVPITVSLSFMTLFAWVASWALNRHLAPILEGVLPGALVSALVAAAAIAAAIPAGRITSRPFSGLFHTEEGRRRSELVGQVVTVTTSRVDLRFGQAELPTEGADLILDIRCDPQRALTRGEQALIISFDDEDEVYIVEPLRTAGQAVEAAHTQRQQRGAASAQKSEPS